MYAFRHAPHQQAILCNFVLLQRVAVCSNFVCANKSYLFEKRQNFSQKKGLDGAAVGRVSCQNVVLCKLALLQCVAMCCSMLQCVKGLDGAAVGRVSCQNVVLCKLALLQCVAVCCNVLQYVAVRFSLLQRASAVECVPSPDDRLCRHALLQRVAVCCSLLPKN